MAHFIILQDGALRNYLEAFHGKFSAPQWKYFFTVLMGLLHCNGNKTFSGMLREVAVMVTMSGLSRFLISPAWNVAVLDQVRYQQFTREVSPIVAQLHLQQKAQRVRRRGRPSPTLVTGYLIMDDSTHAKRYYAKAASRRGRHYSSIEKKRRKGIVCSRPSMRWKITSFPSPRACTARKRCASRWSVPFAARWSCPSQSSKILNPWRIPTHMC